MVLGIDDSPGTRLAVDFSRVGAYILKLGGGKKVAAYNRKILYKVAATFENLSKVSHQFNSARLISTTHLHIFYLP